MTLQIAPRQDLLDDPGAMRDLDPSGMMDLTVGFAAQCREAVRIAAAFAPGPVPQRPVNNVVVTALGGSAIGGDLLRCLAARETDVPLIVNRDYTLPAFVSKDTLVIAASYSGGTEETLAAYAQARQRGAQIVCVTSGGILADRADTDGAPVWRIPGGQPPRASTGYLFFSMLAALAWRGLLRRSVDADVEETLELLEDLRGEYGPSVATDANPAKALARELQGRVPVFYGAQEYLGVVAVRWKGQYNENAKSHAFANVLPEQNHNEILAWALARRQAPRWSVVYLRDPRERLETPRLAHRVDVTAKVIGRSVRSREVVARGESLLARMFSLVYLGDFASVYAAYLNGIDPTIIPGIDRLKSAMRRFKG